MKRDATLHALAWSCALLHLAGLAAAAVGMRPGTPERPLAERMAYIAGAPLGWVAGWSLWMLAALSVLALFAVLRVRAPDPERAALRGCGLSLVSAAVAVDLLCDALYVTVLPALARDRSEALFVAFERVAGVGGAVAANALYSLAVLLVGQSAAEGRRWSYATAALGGLMVVAGFTGDPRHLAAVTGPLVFCVSVWVLVVARGELRATE